MDNLPFSSYDFFGYLSCGFLIIFAWDFFAGGATFLQTTPDVRDIILILIGTYIIGHINAIPSKIFIEDTLIGKILKEPHFHLMGQMKNNIIRFAFPGYSKMFSNQIRVLIINKAKSVGITDYSDTLYNFAFAKVKTCEVTMGRLNCFLNLYGFCRNMSFCFAVISAIIIYGWVKKVSPDNLKWLLVSVPVTIMMFYRYLKFYRAYSKEILISYLSDP